MTRQTWKKPGKQPTDGTPFLARVGAIESVVVACYIGNALVLAWDHSPLPPLIEWREIPTKTETP